ncbi:MAG: hypothetical protein PVG99_07095 [Desulfobacteraceae bacterium]|jgi:hypothetical protein
MIHVENLTRYFGDLCAVDDINLDIQPTPARSKACCTPWARNQIRIDHS